ncbi:MAG: GWxTD domain-containing protein [Sphingobacteriales bacterium]|nr:MAG: GWxTD domain-containing protein [Sphingobacteriales bacterium]
MTRWSWLCIAAMLMGIQAKAIEAVSSYTLFYLQAKDSYKPYIEVYWQIHPASLQMSQGADSMWSGTIETTVTLTSDTGVVVRDAFALQTPAAESREQASYQTVIDLHRYSLPTGKIKLELQFSDGHKPQNTYTYSDSFTVAPIGTEPFYSGIQLVDTTYKTTRESIFQKNDQLQIPLSMNYIGDDRTRLRFYTELYHSDAAKHYGRLTQNTYISKKALDKPVLNLITTDTINAAHIIPFNGMFDISTLPSGNYYLNVALLDEKQNQLAAKSIFFQRSNIAPEKRKATDTSEDTSFAPIYKVNVFDLANTFVGEFNVAKLRAVLKMIEPVASANEKNSIYGFLESPDQTYMQYFVYNFFKGRNPIDPDKEWKEYTDKVREVNKLFGNSSTRGYETDRGQMYLKYGKPNERIIVLNEQGALPYEIWQYNAPGKQSSQGIFLFYRPTYMITDMILLHTTVMGEVRNTQWRSMLYTGSQMQIDNSRATQYLPYR